MSDEPTQVGAEDDDAPLRERVTRTGRRLTRRLESLRSETSGLADEVSSLQEQVDELRAEVRQLKKEAHLDRRLQRRMAELTDIVTELLLPATQRDEQKLAELLDGYEGR
jgi:predicted RNase H-like nuclease (RuvC/YqgF family)